MDDINIRIAEPTDKDKINELFIQMIEYVNNENKKIGIQVDENLFKDGYEEGYLDDFFLGNEKVIIVAELPNSEVIGYLSCISNYEQDKSYFYFDDFCVDSNYRGNGIGKMLIQAATDYADDLGISSLRLHVDENNSKAINLYNGLGFINCKIENGRIEMMRKIEHKKIKKV